MRVLLSLASFSYFLVDVICVKMELQHAIKLYSQVCHCVLGDDLLVVDGDVRLELEFACVGCEMDGFTFRWTNCQFPMVTPI